MTRRTSIAIVVFASLAALYTAGHLPRRWIEGIAIAVVILAVLGIALHFWGDRLCGDIQTDLGEDQYLDHRGHVRLVRDGDGLAADVARHRGAS